MLEWNVTILKLSTSWNQETSPKNAIMPKQFLTILKSSNLVKLVLFSDEAVIYLYEGVNVLKVSL